MIVLVPIGTDLPERNFNLSNAHWKMHRPRRHCTEGQSLPKLTINDCQVTMRLRGSRNSVLTWEELPLRRNERTIPLAGSLKRLET